MTNRFARERLASVIAALSVTAALSMAAALAPGLAAAQDGAAAQEQPAPGSQMKRTIAYLTDDEEINAAIDQARRSLPRFVSIHQSRRDAPEKLDFLVRVAVEDGAGGFEYRWMENVMLAPDAVTGAMWDDGSDAAPVKKGETHRADPDAIADWMILAEGGAIIGAYTTRVDVSRADEETRQLYEGRFLD